MNPAPDEFRLELLHAHVVVGDGPLAEVWPHLDSGRPCLVVAPEKQSRLLGILTAFDLL